MSQFESDLRAEHGLQLVLRAGDEGDDVDDLWLEPRLPRGDKELAGHPARPIRCAQDLLRVRDRVLVGRIVRDEFGVTADGHHRVVEVVRHDPGEMADYLHPLGLA